MRRDPIKRWLSYYRMIAVWGGVLLVALFFQNLPVFSGRVWVVPFVPLLAGWKRGRAVGLFVGVFGGMLQDWTSDGRFGMWGLILGAVGFLTGVMFG